MVSFTMISKNVPASTMRPIDLFLSRVGEYRQDGKGYLCRCTNPSHDDSNPSLHVEESRDGTLLLKCMSRNCDYADIMRGADLELKDGFPSLSNGFQPKLAPKKKRDTRLFLTAEDLIAEVYESKLGKPVCYWPYLDASSNEIAREYRFEPTGQRKEYRVISRGPHRNGWLNQWPEPRPLYCLPEILAAEPNEFIGLCEGGKAGNAVRSLDVKCTAVLGGSKAKPEKNDLAPLAGKVVPIFIDNDPPGREFGESFGTALLQLDPPAKPLIVQLPAENQGDDAHDWVQRNQHRSKKELRRELLDLVSKAEPFIPSEKKDAKQKKKKSDSDQLSHLRLAQAFVGSISVDGVCRFCLHGGDLYEWRGDRYERSHNKGLQDIRNLLWLWLDAMECGPTKNLVGSILDAVIPLISSQRDTPAVSTIFWRGNPSSSFPKDADLSICIPTKTELIIPHGSHYAVQWPSIPRNAGLFVRDCMPFDFARDANGLIHCPKPERWLTFLDEIFGGEADQVDALQLWFGYCLTQDSSQQKILFLTGPSRSGKGKLATILQHIVGRHMSVGTSLYVLAGRFGIGSLLGKRVAIFSDERRLSPAIYAEVLPRLLAISGQDTVTIDRKNRDEITARLGCRLMILSNELSPILDEGQALTARTILLRTRRTWAGNEDFNLERDLLAELPGILKWSLDGMARILMGQRLTSPHSTKDELDSIRDDANPLADFLQFIVDDSEGWIDQDDFLKAIRTWARQTDNLPMERITKKRATMLLTSARPHVKVAQKRCSDSPESCDTDNRKRGYSGVRIDTQKACMADLLF